jgi:hypothetical protein
MHEEIDGLDPPDTEEVMSGEGKPHSSAMQLLIFER